MESKCHEKDLRWLLPVHFVLIHTCHSRLAMALARLAFIWLVSYYHMPVPCTFSSALRYDVKMLISDNEDNYCHNGLTTFQFSPPSLAHYHFSKCLHENKATLCTMTWEVRSLQLWLMVCLVLRPKKAVPPQSSGQLINTAKTVV